MSNNASISHEQCLSEEQLLKYVEGTMTRTEERAIDRHIASCELCSDALEGAMMISATDFKQHSASIGEKMDTAFSKNLLEKTENIEPNEIPAGPTLKENTVTTLKPVRSLRVLRWVAMAAASVLVLVTAGIWFLTTDAPNVDKSAQETVVEAPPQYSTENEQKTLPDSSTTGMSTAAVQDKMDQATPLKTIPKPLPPSAPSSEKNIAEVQDKASSGSFTKASEPSTTFGSAPKQEAQPIDNQIVTQNDNSAIEQAAYKEKSQNTGNAQAPVAEYSKSKKDEAVANARAKAKPAATSPAPAMKALAEDEKLFQIGLNYYNQQDYSNALANFNQVKPKSNLQEQVQWYMALAQLKSGDKAQAKTILETIVKAKGKYAESATQLLKKEF
jgi:hypothetical protein